MSDERTIVHYRPATGTPIDLSLRGEPFFIAEEMRKRLFPGVDLPKRDLTWEKVMADQKLRLAKPRAE